MFGALVIWLMVVSVSSFSLPVNRVPMTCRAPLRSGVGRRSLGNKQDDVPEVQGFDPLHFTSKMPSMKSSGSLPIMSPMLGLSAFMSSSQPASAAGLEAVPSALAAYGHYLGLVLVAGSLATERALVRPGMSDEAEEQLVIADALYGIAGVLVFYTGYLRATEFGKGWDFYAHEPVFWVKMTLAIVMGTSSLFPTIKIIQRAVAKRNGEEVPPMSEKLAKRMTTIINGEILAVASIPLAASLMSRGVAYADWLPWPVGAAPVALATAGLGFKYAKEALSWEEDAP